MKEKKKIVGYRRVRGRIVPITVKNEVAAATDIAKKSASTGAAPKIVGLFAAGAGAQFAAGRMQRASDAAVKSAKFFSKYNLLNRAAKISKFTGKYGAAALIGTQFLKVDKASKKDEKSKLFNLGASHSPARIVLALGAAFAGGRVLKRFEKWGLRGGAFPTKLRDI